MTDSKQIFQRYYEDILKNAKNEKIYSAIINARNAWRIKKARALARFPETLEMAKEVRKIKEYSINNLEILVQQLANVLQENGANVYYAHTNSEALTTIGKIIGKNKIVVAAKSITAEEIGLRNYVEKLGNEYWETDVGEFIQQIRQEKPMHYALPAIHVTQKEAHKILSDFFQKDIPNEAPALVAEIRTFLKEKYSIADFGISGCNSLAADTGTAFIIENEGNIRVASGMPTVSIIISGIEKIVPTMHDAFKVAEVTWRYAGFTTPAYLNLISAPSSTADIEFQYVRGASGPRELHVILLDCGRSILAKETKFKEALYCLKCGNCLFECPIYQLSAGHYGGYGHFIAIGTIWNAYVTSSMEIATPMAYTCLRCGRCAEICPVSIDSRKLVTYLRQTITDLAYS